MSDLMKLEGPGENLLKSNDEQDVVLVGASPLIDIPDPERVPHLATSSHYSE